MKDYLLHIGLSIVAVFAPEKAAILTILTLILFDLMTGIWASVKTSVPITSAALRRSITKICVYEIALLAGFLTQKYLTGDTLPLTNIVSSFIGLTEIKSVLENINIISGGSLLTSLITKLGSSNES